MVKKVALIINPNAGKQKLAQQLDKIQSRLTEIFEEVTILQTKKEGDGERFVEKHAEEVDLLIAGGGDGTVFEIMNALVPLKNRPVFAILPGGTCNDFSRTLGISQKPIEALEQIIMQKRMQVDVGKYGENYFLNFWGIGIISKVAEEMDEANKQVFGRVSYYLNTSRLAFQNEAFALKLHSEEFDYDEKAELLVVGNGSFLGGIQSFFPNADVQDGKFDVLIVKEAKLKYLKKWLEAKIQDDYPENEKDDDIIYFRTNRLEVSTSPEQNIDCDGEFLNKTPATIEVLPKHLDMIYGEME
ncbi:MULTISPECIES: diacylglycerol/lipid kinase family protein [Oceanobacillus]|uniref:Diacylglycerol/lipid kinase family protein n=1 Tax=Oceanobacillus aidingensis TaxID=645964 RepID=A0ABV9JYW8_9BACI|nr:diacylglycerol kinase family protein [Oceanobacillus oncorhynchi]MDM8102680.1 diacylglycerol kinase family lipid kinase [Oceanobacillus oncorhynchi]